MLSRIVFKRSKNGKPNVCNRTKRDLKDLTSREIRDRRLHRYPERNDWRCMQSHKSKLGRGKMLYSLVFLDKRATKRDKKLLAFKEPVFALIKATRADLIPTSVERLPSQQVRQ
ncbi:hypothetical protein NPIL_391021 [Nephila pilipes]|uniref:Uncharacterized protein n=2 Tax=Nephila pilipes TaxID=299642 RepID=A0A8X6U080_NEPPI|nr:hypothetical protein NPIL_391021 [Nephila pilipes]